MSIKEVIVDAKELIDVESVIGDVGRLMMWDSCSCNAVLLQKSALNVEACG